MVKTLDNFLHAKRTGTTMMHLIGGAIIATTLTITTINPALADQRAFVVQASNHVSTVFLRQSVDLPYVQLQAAPIAGSAANITQVLPTASDVHILEFNHQDGAPEFPDAHINVN